MLKNKKDMLTIGIVAIVIVLAAGYYFVLSPFLTQSSRHADEMSRARETLSQAEADLATAQKYQDEYPSVLDVNTVLVENFPATADVESLNRSILLAASQAGIMPDQVTTISTSTPVLMAPPAAPAATDGTTTTEETATDTATDTAADAETPAVTVDPAASAKMAQMSVTISITGSPSALMATLTNLAAMDRVILLTSASMSTDSEGAATLTIQGVSYLYALLDDPTTDTDEEAAVPIEPTGSESTATPTPTPAP